MKSIMKILIASYISEVTAHFYVQSKKTKIKVDEGEAAYLGISGVNVTEEVSQMYGMPKGVYIGQVYEGTAADKAGIVKGDIITKFDGSSITSMEELQKVKLMTMN